MLLTMKTPIPTTRLILANQHPKGITKKAAVSHIPIPSLIRKTRKEAEKHTTENQTMFQGDSIAG